MSPSACVVHRIRGRVRLRIREKCKDPAYFEEVRNQLASLPGVEQVRINCITGTVLLLHPAQSYTQLAEQLRRLDLFKFIDGPEPLTPALAPVASGISRVDRAIAGGSGGTVDLRTLAYIGLMVLTVRQIMRGQVLGPALPMVWQALSLIDRVNGWKQAASAATSDSDAAPFASAGDTGD